MNYLIHNISINLNHIRKAKGMSLDVVAEQTGVSKSMLAGIERGTANPSIGVIDKILSGLRIELADLTQAPVKDAYLVNVENIAPTKDVPGDIRVGRSTVEKLASAAKKIGGTHAFIISGPHLTKMSHVQHCAGLMATEGIPSDIFNQTEGNPSVETVAKAAEAFRASGADFIVAFGGGSPMDVAKAVAVVAKYGGSITEYEGGGKVPGDIIPLIAIPTTAGTGKYRKIYNYISPTPAADDFEPIELVSLLRELNAELGIPASLKETGVIPDKFDAMADDAMKSGNIAVNPRATTQKDVLALYEKTL